MTNPVLGRKHGPYRDGSPWAVAAIAGLFLIGTIIAPDEPMRDVGARPGASGTGQAAAALAPAPFPLRLRAPRLVISYLVRATAYTSSVDETDATPWIGACGRVGPGTVAVSSDLMRVAPCGTRVELLGRRYVVADHMPGRRRVDVWHATKTEALAYGVRTGTIAIVLD